MKTRIRGLNLESCVPLRNLLRLTRYTRICTMQKLRATGGLISGLGQQCRHRLQVCQGVEGRLLLPEHHLWQRLGLLPSRCHMGRRKIFLLHTKTPFLGIVSLRATTTPFTIGMLVCNFSVTKSTLGISLNCEILPSRQRSLLARTTQFFWSACARSWSLLIFSRIQFVRVTPSGSWPVCCLLFSSRMAIRVSKHGAIVL